MPTFTEHDVICSHCGATWRDSHPDQPGAVIWCGECDREADGTAVIKVLNETIRHVRSCGKATISRESVVVNIAHDLRYTRVLPPWAIDRQSLTEVQS